MTEGDAAPPLLQSSRQQSAPLSIVAANKHAKHMKKARHDIEDKFCKFEIKVRASFAGRSSSLARF